MQNGELSVTGDLCHVSRSSICDQLIERSSRPPMVCFQATYSGYRVVSPEDTFSFSVVLQPQPSVLETEEGMKSRLTMRLVAVECRGHL